MLDGQCPANIQHDPGKRAQPGCRRRLYPRTHEPLFRDTLREGGINPYFYEMANIREHCSWVHSRETRDATQKAKDIVRMSVARTALLEPLQEFELPVDKRGLVIGGGVAGMTSALSLAEQGFEVFLLEKDKDLGGMARRIHYTLEGLDVQAYLDDLIRKVYKHSSIHVYTDIILKPSLLGGFSKSKEIIEAANKMNIAWWATSALEANIGLNAIAQWVFTFHNQMPQGLGTGQLFENNIPSPLLIKNANLHHGSQNQWNLDLLKK